MAEIANAFGGAAQVQATQRYIGQVPALTDLSAAAQYPENTIAWVTAEASFYRVVEGVWTVVDSTSGPGFSGLYADLTGVPVVFAPTAHAASHAEGGTDPITPESLGLVAGSDATAIAGVTVDDTAIDDGKVLTYDAGSGQLVYVVPVPSGTILRQPSFEGYRIVQNLFTGVLIGGTWTASFDTNDYYGVITASTNIKMPSTTGHRWEPTFEIKQGPGGGFSVTFLDQDGNVIRPLSSSLTPDLSEGAVNFYTVGKSLTNDVWYYVCLNTMAAQVDTTVYEVTGQTLGLAPAGITNRWEADTLVMAEDVTFGVADLRRVYIEISALTNSFRLNSIDEATPFIDGEVLMLVRSGGTTDHQAGVALRADAPDSTKVGYMVNLYAGTTLRLSYFRTGGRLTLVDAPFVWAANTEYWIRFRAVGTALQVKAWAYTEAEPAAWTIDTTDGNLTTGWLGFGAYIKDQPHRFCYIAWRTDGGTVAVPA